MERDFLSGPGGVGLLGSQSVAFGGPWYRPFAQYTKDGAPPSYFLPAIERAGPAANPIGNGFAGGVAGDNVCVAEFAAPMVTKVAGLGGP